MRIRLWGARGSLPTPGAGTARYGGNTACVEVRADRGSVVILDAGTGIRLLSDEIGGDVTRVDLLLSHLHMDHIIGLGFFDALFRADLEIHMWGPASTVLDLRGRLSRYLSPPLFPVRLRDLPCQPVLHDVPLGTFEIPGLEVTAAFICHPGPTVGYRLSDGTHTLAYLPDHEPALGSPRFPKLPRWTSGHALAAEADLLIHDAQYDSTEYHRRVGWGHSAVEHAVAFAEAAAVGHLIPFHHDPRHDDETLDRLYAAVDSHVEVTPGREGQAFELGPSI